MDLIVITPTTARLGDRVLRCATGHGGFSAEKHEGDGATPVGSWICRELLYRPDRLAPPPCGLPVRPIAAHDGWCDDPVDAAYNRPVPLPYPGRTEALWRADRVYDLIVPLSYNDDPVVPGRGSAIFLHLARPDFTPTEGCVALGLDDLRAFLAQATPRTRVVVIP